MTTWAPRVTIDGRDCRTLSGHPRPGLVGDVVHLAPTDDPDWLRVRVRYWASVLAEAPDYELLLVRRSALPEEVLPAEVLPADEVLRLEPLRLLGSESDHAQP